MLKRIEDLSSQALSDVEQAGSLEELDHVRVAYLGKKGLLSEVLKGLKDVSLEDRPKVGAAANELKQKIQTSIENRKEVLSDKWLDAKLEKERVDVSLPSRLQDLGRIHPITQTFRRIIQVLSKLGFDVTTGPEAETDYLCFEAVNIPADHPARDMQDTFFLGPGVVLRTHTSAVQIRTMLSRPWPIKIISPGAVYRKDSDATHTPMFHQIEALWVDKHVRMSDLRGVLDYFAREIFGPDARVRMRPSYFPFVEPGAEVDVYVPKYGWLEILGAGMVHPNLFKEVGYPADEFQGFAFGMGIERIAMILHGVSDLRMFFQNDLRFLQQF